MLAESVRIAVPYTCAAIGGIWAERSGVIQIGLEGILLSGAFAAVAVAHASGSPLLSLLAAASTRMGLRALYDSSSNSPSIGAFRLGPTGSTGLSMLVRVLADPV